MNKKLFSFVISLLPILGIAQNIDSIIQKPLQVNEVGVEIFADAPWRMKKTDGNGNVSGIPVTIFINEADEVGSTVDLISINISLKNSLDTVFSSPILFDSYTTSNFNSLFSAKSVFDDTLDIQDFDASLPLKSTNSTIIFTADTCAWPYTCTYTKVSHKFWYVTFTIPADKLVGFDDLIDIKVDFSLDWQTDVTSMLRVFRDTSDIPKITNWYRGDTHVHTIYTQNLAEFGSPLDATKIAAKRIGLDWITTTDHSTDFDNYGASMNQNWSRLGREEKSLNNTDNFMIFIRAMEVSVNNSDGKIVHLLSYPSETTPFNMPYLGDGGGDLTSGTTKSIDDVLTTVSQYNGFCFAAHPFAPGDKLGIFVDGGNWNLNDANYKQNGDSVQGYGLVICNDLGLVSDIYSTQPSNYLIKNDLKGGQLWNCRRGMVTTDEYMDPWNVTYDSNISAFAPLNLTNPDFHLNRFFQGLDVANFINKQGLIRKNLNSSYKNFKFFMEAGSDSHGSFNYSNTDFVFNTTDIHDNALGKLATIAYCPQGMGIDGSNVIKALKYGNTILSDGPMVVFGLSTDGTNSTNEIIIGQDTALSMTQYLNARLIVNAISSSEYGPLQNLDLIVGTQNTESVMSIPVNSLMFDLNYNLDSLINSVANLNPIASGEYFYIRAAVSSLKNYGSLSSVYKTTHQFFHSYTNPIWLKKPLITNVSDQDQFLNNMSIKVYPNPFNEVVNIEYGLNKASSVKIEFYNTLGQLIMPAFYDKQIEGYYHKQFEFSGHHLASNLYILKISIDDTSKYFKMFRK